LHYFVSFLLFPPSYPELCAQRTDEVKGFFAFASIQGKLDTVSFSLTGGVYVCIPLPDEGLLDETSINQFDIHSVPIVLCVRRPSDYSE